MATAADKWAQSLERGEILCYAKADKACPGDRVVVKALIDAAPERVWSLVNACGDYKNVMPRIKRSKEISRKGNKVACLLTIDMPFPYSDLTSITDGVHAVGGKRWSRRWKLKSGDYEENRGQWLLRPYRGAANRTYVVYQACVKPKAWVPGWVRSMAQKRSLPKMIENMRAKLSASK